MSENNGNGNNGGDDVTVSGADFLAQLLANGGQFDANPGIDVQELEETVKAQKEMLTRWEGSLGTDKQVALTSVAYAYYANEGDIDHLNDEIGFLTEEKDQETLPKVQAVLDWQIEARGRLKALVHTLSAPQA